MPAPAIKPLQPTVKTVEVPRVKTIKTSTDKDPAQVKKELDEVKADDAKANTQVLVSAVKSLMAKNLLPAEDMQLMQREKRRETVDVGKLPAATQFLLLGSITGRDNQIHSYKTVPDGFTSKTIVGPPKTTMTASVVSSYQYDSNVFSKKNGAVSDKYLNIVPGVTLVIPTSNVTKFTYVLRAAYARYDERTTQDSDVLAGVASYSTQLSSVSLDERSATKRTEILTATLSGTGSYGPGFSGPGTRFYSPSVVWQVKHCRR